MDEANLEETFGVPGKATLTKVVGHKNDISEGFGFHLVFFLSFRNKELLYHEFDILICYYSCCMATKLYFIRPVGTGRP